MTKLLILLCITFYIIALLAIIFTEIENQKKYGGNNTFLVIINWIVIIFSVLNIITFRALFINSKSPQAIDVYRGNTELKIYYSITPSDTIALDTTVQWKHKEITIE